MQSNTKITVLANGPLLVEGTITITKADGTTDLKNKSSLCRCGHSANKPYCDGAHKKSDFKG
jgi:CDGSH-type Zn-finger protein